MDELKLAFVAGVMMTAVFRDLQSKKSKPKKTPDMVLKAFRCNVEAQSKDLIFDGGPVRVSSVEFSEEYDSLNEAVKDFVEKEYSKKRGVKKNG
ncbi:MAG: hypothetical protein KGI50_07315 [Patescibacteria group bacterium]|nr:hypothetical protein [Patescibacteria group bacterium]MDE2439099.1 hypothetical protein [Patescibacteria group bacterium]